MARRKPRKPVAQIQGPTPEQHDRAPFELAVIVDSEGSTARRLGKAFRRVRMVELLHKRGTLSDEQAKALRHYRHHADMADRSPIRDSLNQQRGGKGLGPTVSLLNAQRVATDCERAAGSLQPMLRAVIVDDVTLTEWASSHGNNRDQATLDIRALAGRVMSELDAW